MVKDIREPPAVQESLVHSRQRVRVRYLENPGHTEEDGHQLSCALYLQPCLGQCPYPSSPILRPQGGQVLIPKIA